jgi:F0F1-type ATP synthase membrane subunit b/b'
VIIQCIPLPVLLKASSNRRAVISLSVDKNEKLKGLLKLLTAKIQENLNDEGLEYIKNSTKLVLSELNH